MPIWYLFAGSMTPNGTIRIWIEMDQLNRNKFINRQKWMIKILGVLEYKLMKGNMLISKDKLLYYINKNELEGSNTKNDLEEVYNWILDENKNVAILNIIKNIMPEEEIIYYKSIPM